MKTVVDDNLAVNLDRKSKNYHDISPQFESTKEITKIIPKSIEKVTRTIKEVMTLLKKSEDFGNGFDLRYECVQNQLWKNSNRLLRNDRNYVGIKTGITKNAGCCLSSQKKKKNTTLTCSKNKFIFIIFKVLLGTSSIDKRFKETAMLMDMCSVYKDELISFALKDN